MIQFNLLPDVKLEFIKTRRTQRLVIISSLIISAASIFLTLSLYVGVNILQKRSLQGLEKNIKESSKKLENEKNINKMLTVQNQLNSLNSLHEEKPALFRVGHYLGQITPNDVALSNVEIDTEQKTIQIRGVSSNIKNVNQYVDTIKFTKYESIDISKILEETANKNNKSNKSNSTEKPVEANAFKNTVLETINRIDSDGSNNDKPVSFTITLSYDPLIFDVKQKVNLKIPKKITSRSVTERSTPLLKPDDSKKEN